MLAIHAASSPGGGSPFFFARIMTAALFEWSVFVGAGSELVTQLCPAAPTTGRPVT